MHNRNFHLLKQERRTCKRLIAAQLASSKSTQLEIFKMVEASRLCNAFCYGFSGVALVSDFPAKQGRLIGVLQSVIPWGLVLRHCDVSICDLKIVNRRDLLYFKMTNNESFGEYSEVIACDVFISQVVIKNAFYFNGPVNRLFVFWISKMFSSLLIIYLFFSNYLFIILHHNGNSQL